VRTASTIEADGAHGGDIRPPHRSSTPPKRLVVGADVSAALLGMTIAFIGRAELPGHEAHTSLRAHVLLIVLGVPTFIICFSRARLYLAQYVADSLAETWSVLRATLTAAASMALIAFVLDLRISRGFLLLVPITVAVLVCIERALVRQHVRKLRRTGRLQRPMVVVGANAEGRAVAAAFDGGNELGLEVVGFVDDDLPVGDEVLPGMTVLAPVEQCIPAIDEVGAKTVVIVSSAMDIDAASRLAKRCTDTGHHVNLLSHLSDIDPRRLLVQRLGPHASIYLEPVHRSGWRLVAKRVFDIVVASICLLLSGVVLLVTAVAIRIDSPGPVLFRQRRVGRDGRPFLIYKLRTMVPDAEARLETIIDLNEADGPLFKIRKDPRITRVGRVLRTLSIDELPQLFNVLRGDMSLVGPRPALEVEVEGWTGEVHNRLRVQPGITGLWQVSGRSSSSFDEYARLDLHYVDNWSLVSDLAILVRTIPAVLSRRGAC
jgi:exopolysaccharide biosynthesis polyprenyl glycosylphosphotransferase